MFAKLKFKKVEKFVENIVIIKNLSTVSLKALKNFHLSTKAFLN